MKAYLRTGSADARDSKDGISCRTMELWPIAMITMGPDTRNVLLGDKQLKVLESSLSGPVLCYIGAFYLANLSVPSALGLFNLRSACLPELSSAWASHSTWRLGSGDEPCKRQEPLRM